MPYYLSINNYLYPTLAILSIPFLIITAKYLIAGDLRVEQLSRAAAVAFLIYAPFAFTPLGDWLISVESQEKIGRYGVEEFGAPLFTPDSEPWREK